MNHNNESTSEQTLIAAASSLLTAYQNIDALYTPPAGISLDRDSAYRIQQQVVNQRGPVGGFKAGRSGPSEVPIVAPIFAANVWASGTPVPHDSSRLRGVELEVGFLLLNDPPALEDMNFEDALRESVTAFAALEIVESRLLDRDAFGPWWKLADNQVNGGLITGATVAEWSTLDLAARDAKLTIGSNVVWDGPAQVPGGNAFDVLVAFARHIGNHCGGLHAGQRIITGSLTGVDFAEAGDQIEGWIDGLGYVTTTFPAF